MKFNICTIAVRKTTVLFAISKTFRIIAVLNHTEVGDKPPSIRWRIFYVYHSTHDKRIRRVPPFSSLMATISPR